MEESKYMNLSKITMRPIDKTLCAVLQGQFIIVLLLLKFDDRIFIFDHQISTAIIQARFVKNTKTYICKCKCIFFSNNPKAIQVFWIYVILLVIRFSVTFKNYSYFAFILSFEVHLF